jgi:acylphosphatase
MDPVFCSTVFFHGHVQGVGFRYTTLQIAKEFEVCGYVSNLPDGRVVLEAEGAKENVTAFTQAVKDRLHGYIRKVEDSSVTRPPVHQGFMIK